ncbi:MAG: FGGY family carbohydrate kinase [Christensenellaceae bacterium]
MKQYLIAIDIGTQGTKCILFDTEMNVIADSFEISNLISDKPGMLKQDPLEIYASCIHTIKAVMEKSDINPIEVCAIGIDGQMAGILGVDAQGEASTYYDSWLDTRCGKYVKEMKEKAGKKIIEITGGVTSYTHGPKILWWKNEQPCAYQNTHKFVLPHNYVIGKMCGLKGDDAVFDYTCIHFSGFGDNQKKEWSQELLEIFGVDKSKMARIVSPFEVVGKTTKEFARESGLIEGISVVAGAGDTAAGTFGSGLIEKGMLLDSAGTASVMCCVVDEYKPDTQNETMMQMPSPIDGLWLPLSYIGGGGLCVRWFRDEFTGKPAASYDELMTEAQEVSAGSEGVLFTPHFAGRAYPSNPYVKGSFIGLDWKHTRGHLYRAVMEGIAYEYDYYYSILKEQYPTVDFKKMYTIGGGSKSSLFNSIKSDVLGLPVTPYKQGETALVGSAVIAGYGTGVFSDYRKPLLKVSEEGSTVQPNMENNQAYKKYAREYLNVIKALDCIYKSDVYQIEG